MCLPHAKALILTAVLATLAPRAALAQGESAGDPAQVVQSFVEAFNRHDVEGMISLVADDIELYYQEEDGVFGLASGTSEQLARDMQDYFARRPDVRSRVDGINPGPIFVSSREQIVGGDSSVAVYEIRDGRIRRAWYFPAEASDSRRDDR